MTDSGPPVVLVAEDEPSVAEGYELWLGGDYEVRTVHDGADALAAIDDTVDVVILDRMMPELSGGQVLRAIRDRGLDCMVAMVTAVEPDFDVVEMGFDAYLTKPPDRQELVDTIERLLDRADLDDTLQEYYSLMARKGALQSQKTEAELEANEAYRSLLERIEEMRAAVDDELGDMGSDVDFVSAVREVDDADGEFDPDADGGFDLDDDGAFEPEGDR